MDIDGVDGLTRSFGRITTADADSLIGQFKQILSESYGDLSEETCTFFLDMNNWNLPAALGCFYDYDAKDMLNVPQMMFVNDVTMGEDESVPPSTKFLKTWCLLNNGKKRWPDGCMLKRVQGNYFACYLYSDVSVQAANPGQLIRVDVEMTSPPLAGVYHSLWRLTSPSDVPFGDQIWCIITVEENAIVDVTQKLADTHCFEEQNETSHKVSLSSLPDLSFLSAARLNHVISQRLNTSHCDDEFPLAQHNNTAVFSTPSMEHSSVNGPCYSMAEQYPVSETNVEATFQMCSTNPAPTVECAMTEFSTRNFLLNCGAKDEQCQQSEIHSRTLENSMDHQSPEKR